MSSFAEWAGSGAGIVIVVACWVVMRHLRHMPSWSHPWLHRTVILGMYVGGCTIMLTRIGSFIIDAEQFALGFAGGSQSGLGHTIIVAAGLILAASVIIGLIFDPGLETAWTALALPAVLAISGGHLHALLTVVPGPAIAQQVSSWLGG